MRIGNRATSFTNPALSTMDEVLFYDSELTQSQITSIFTGAGPVASPRAYYKFNENAGTTTTDLSGNGFTGTITSPSWVSSKTTRTTSTTRTTATNRVVVRDMGTALDTFASSGYVAIGTGINAAINSANAYTFAQWVKRGPVKGTLQSFMGAPGGDKAWFNFLADNSVRLYNQDLTPPTVNTLAASGSRLKV